MTMNPIDEIRARFDNYPTVQYEEGSNWIRYRPGSEDGFRVELHVLDDAFVVYFDGWHEHFHDAESALECFAFGLSQECRVKVHARGGKPHKWVVQSLKDGKWVTDSETGYFAFAFWRSKNICFKQNALIKSR